MLKLHKINPAARAVGTIGVVAALIGGVTFASLQSNAVAISPNEVTTGTASLQIAAPDNVGGCSNAAFGTANVPGFNVPHFTSETNPTPIAFCLKNSGDVALKLTGSIPQDVSGATASAYTTLDVNCVRSGEQSAVLNAWHPNGFIFTGTINAGDTDFCTAKLTLDPSYPGNGGETIPAFSIQFVGNESTAV